MASPELPLIELSKLLYSSSRLLIQRIQQTLNEFGLTYLQFLVLSILWEKDGIKVFQLGEKLDLDSGTLTPLLKKLESQNLLRRKRGEADERTVTVHLTYPGKTLQSKTLAAVRELEEKLNPVLSDEVEGLLSGMQDFLEKLKTLKK